MMELFAGLAVAAAPAVAQAPAPPPPAPPPDEAVVDGVAAVFWDVWDQVVGICNYPIYKAEGGGTITPGKILLALVLIVIGDRIARRLSHLLADRVLGRFSLTVGAIAIFRTLAYYLLLVAFFLWALELVSIPLTFFTFIGGALAIGLGFGSQNIVNNFMSGLILMAEQPVKVGDLIEVDGQTGKVDQIGARSTRIRSGDNTHFILPNSRLLESAVLNWTLSDHQLRTSVDVGVAYGSDVQEVHRRLLAAVARCERVLKEPKPEVLFLDFGDNALVFRTYFWIEVRLPLDTRRAQSELRFEIEALLREADITIAFPQRDVHFDPGPLEVRVLRDQSSSHGSSSEESQPLRAK